MPGAGRKTSAVVLGEAYGVAEGIAVDTHCGRLSMRLGLTDTTDPIKAERAADGGRAAQALDQLDAPDDRARPRHLPLARAAVLGVHPARHLSRGPGADGGRAAPKRAPSGADRAHHVRPAGGTLAAMDRLDMELYADRLARDAQRVADELSAARLRLAWAEFEVAARDWLGGDDSRMLEAIGVLRTDRHRRRRGAGRPAPPAARCDRPLPGVRRGAAGGAAGHAGEDAIAAGGRRRRRAARRPRRARGRRRARRACRVRRRASSSPACRAAGRPTRARWRPGRCRPRSRAGRGPPRRAGRSGRARGSPVSSNTPRPAARMRPSLSHASMPASGCG